MPSAISAAVGFGDFALGLQSLAGKTVKAAGDVFAPPRTLSSLVTDEVPMNRVQKAGKWLVDDAEQGRKKLAAELAPDKENTHGRLGAARSLATSPSPFLRLACLVVLWRWLGRPCG